MISFSSVTKRYDSLTAVSNISFTIAQGEFFALLGPNGAGKTTTVKMLLDFVRPTSGEIDISGISSKNPLAREGVGYCGENHRIPPHLTGRAYCRRIASLIGMDKAVAGKKIEAIIDAVGMTGKETMEAKNFSKGMSQRMALAGALLGDPKIVILDEPTSGLDPIGIREIRHILEGLRSRGVTIILNSHLLSEVEKICDTAAIMNHGRILIKDRLATIVGNEETLEDVFIRIVKDPNA